jgi:hypothetical protein
MEEMRVKGAILAAPPEGIGTDAAARLGSARVRYAGERTFSLTPPWARLIMGLCGNLKKTSRIHQE